MTTKTLLENLRKERQELDSAIRYIERATNRSHHASKAAAIVKSVAHEKSEKREKHTEPSAEPAPKKKLHWTQTPAGRRKMSRIQKASWASRMIP